MAELAELESRVATLQLEVAALAPVVQETFRQVQAIITQLSKLMIDAEALKTAQGW